MKSFGQKSEKELERILAGGPASPEGGLEDVSRFAQQVKTAYRAHPAPEVEASHLSAIMEAVRSNPQNGESLASTAALKGAKTAPSRLSIWKKVVLGNVAASLALKILGGAAALAASTAGLAAVDALPGETEHHVERAVEAVTPFEFPRKEEERSQKIRPPSGTLEVEEAPKVPVPAQPEVPNAEFGQSVAEDAKDGGVSGPEVSERAKDEAQRRREQGQAHRPSHAEAPGPKDQPGPPEGQGQSGAGQAPPGVGENAKGREKGAPAGQGISKGAPAGLPPGVSAGR